jgi:hypothetical protein
LLPIPVQEKVYKLIKKSINTVYVWWNSLQILIF